MTFDDGCEPSQTRCNLMYQECFILHRYFDHFHDNKFPYYFYADNLVENVGMLILLPATRKRSVI